MTTVLQAAPVSVLPSPLSLRANYRANYRLALGTPFQLHHSDTPSGRALVRSAAWREVRDEFALVLAEAFSDDSDEWLLAWALAAFRIARARSAYWSTRATALHALDRVAS